MRSATSSPSPTYGVGAPWGNGGRRRHVSSCVSWNPAACAAVRKSVSDSCGSPGRLRDSRLSTDRWRSGTSYACASRRSTHSAEPSWRDQADNAPEDIISPRRAVRADSAIELSSGRGCGDGGLCVNTTASRSARHRPATGRQSRPEVQGGGGACGGPGW
eukprot:7194998-Prymnesium_polylepis.3